MWTSAPLCCFFLLFFWGGGTKRRSERDINFFFLKPWGICWDLYTYMCHGHGHGCMCVCVCVCGGGVTFRIFVAEAKACERKAENEQTVPRDLKPSLFIHASLKIAAVLAVLPPGGSGSWQLHCGRCLHSSHGRWKHHCGKARNHLSWWTTAGMPGSCFFLCFFLMQWNFLMNPSSFFSTVTVYGLILFWDFPFWELICFEMATDGQSTTPLLKVLPFWDQNFADFSFPFWCT